MKLKESETKLEKILVDNPDNQEVPNDSDEALAIFEIDEHSTQQNLEPDPDIKPIQTFVDIENNNIAELMTDHINNDNIPIVNEALVKKVSNLDNEILNKNLNDCVIDETNLVTIVDEGNVQDTTNSEHVTEENDEGKKLDECNTIESQLQNNDDNIVKENELRELLKQNIMSCSEKLSIIENLKCKSPEVNNIDNKQVLFIQCVHSSHINVLHGRFEVHN